MSENKNMRELSLDEMDKVSGGSKTFSTGVGSPNGNFGGLCQTTGCGENQKFWIASPEYIYMEAMPRLRCCNYMCSMYCICISDGRLVLMKYFKISATLGAIALVCALLIA